MRSSNLSILCLLSALLLNGSAVSAQEAPTDEQVKEAKEAFAKVGATYGKTIDPRTKITEHLFRLRFRTSNADLKKLPNPPFAFALDLRVSDVTDGGLKELKDLKNLTRLYLVPRQITDTALANFREIGKLYTLSNALGKDGKPPTSAEDVLSLVLAVDNLTDAGLKELKEFKNLTTLNLNNTKVTDAGLKELKDLKNLTTLSLYSTQVTDAGLKELKELKTLSSLNLASTKVTDTGLKELKEIKTLSSLDLSYTKVTDAGLKELKDLKNLASLNLYGSKITDAGLKDLQDVKTLSALNLGGTKVTDAGVKELQAALPKCKVTRKSE